MCRKPTICPNVTQKCKTCSRLPELGGGAKRRNVSSDYDLPLFSPQCHFSKNTSKEFIIVFHNETVESLSRRLWKTSDCEGLPALHSLLRKTFCYVFRVALTDNSMKLRILKICMFRFYNYGRCCVTFFFRLVSVFTEKPGSQSSLSLNLVSQKASCLLSKNVRQVKVFSFFIAITICLTRNDSILKNS